MGWQGRHCGGAQWEGTRATHAHAPESLATTRLLERNTRCSSGDNWGPTDVLSSSSVPDDGTRLDTNAARNWCPWRPHKEANCVHHPHPASNQLLQRHLTQTKRDKTYSMLRVRHASHRTRSADCAPLVRGLVTGVLAKARQQQLEHDINLCSRKLSFFSFVWLFCGDLGTRFWYDTAVS